MSRELVAAIEVSSAGAIVGNTLGFVGAPVVSGGSSNVYTFTLEPDIDNLECVAFATQTGALGGQASAAPVLVDNTIAVTTYNSTGAGAGSARGFHLGIFRLSPGQTEGDGGIGRLNNSLRTALEPTLGQAFGRTFGITAASTYRTAAGVYTIPLAYQIDPEDAYVCVTPILGATTLGQVGIASMTDSQIVINTYLDMVASDVVPFDMSIWRKAIQG